MLTRLTIKNYALIDELVIDFDRGFNIVTGETGAGKSIILGALSLILGGRADTQTLRDNTKKCVVEGIFEIDASRMKPFFDTHSLDYDDRSIFRREITPAGKSRAFINDTPVNVKQMSEIGPSLIDIHSQLQNLELTSKQFQLDLVDVVADNEKIVSEYQKDFTGYQKKILLLEELKEKAEKEKSDLDYYQFQFDQLEKAGLTENEQEELEEEREKLTHAEEIKSILLRVMELFENEQFSILPMVREGLHELRRIAGYFKDAFRLEERLESVHIELNDIFQELQSQSENLELDPTRLKFLDERLDLIYSLQQKHRVQTVGDLLKLKAQFEKQIAGIVDYDVQIAAREKELNVHFRELTIQAEQISKRRQQTFSGIEKKVIQVLTQLGMPKARFRVIHEKLSNPGKNGLDSIGFLFSANKDMEPAEIARVASGGETSRLMLAVKSLITRKKNLPTLIFDEIDSGVSGEIALKMGDILRDFSRSVQIIHITHLPQIAGKGDHHYKVFKFDNAQGTFTSIKKLDPSERIEELAKMVGGDKPTENAFQTARDLMS
jgi:DNA repair protein RecN (Recombination protein N)